MRLLCKVPKQKAHFPIVDLAITWGFKVRQAQKHPEPGTNGAPASIFDIGLPISKDLFTSVYTVPTLANATDGSIFFASDSVKHLNSALAHVRIRTVLFSELRFQFPDLFLVRMNFSLVVSSPGLVSAVGYLISYLPILLPSLFVGPSVVSAVHTAWFHFLIGSLGQDETWRTVGNSHNAWLALGLKYC